MINRTETERLASMAHELRPDWPVRSLCTWLMADHAHRAYQDVAVALAFIATDPATQTPKRMNEAGPWWDATVRAGSPNLPTSVPRPGDPRCTLPGHERELAHNCRACRSERMGLETQPDDTLALPAEQAARNARGAAAARAALTHPTPSTADARTRAGADTDRSDD